MKKLLTLPFLLVPFFADAGCGGPNISAINSSLFRQFNVLYTSSDTVQGIMPTDTIVLWLDVDNTCEPLHSVSWYKNGILLNSVPGYGMVLTDTVAGPGTYTCTFKYGPAYMDLSFTFYFRATTTGIAALSAGSTDLKVYPNPSNGIFTVDAGTDAQSYIVTVSDVSGRILKEMRGTEKTLTVDLSACAPGFYSLAYIDNSGRRKTKKLIYN